VTGSQDPPAPGHAAVLNVKELDRNGAGPSVPAHVGQGLSGISVHQQGGAAGDPGQLLRSSRAPNRASRLPAAPYPGHAERVIRGESGDDADEVVHEEVEPQPGEHPDAQNIDR
jgi:hypothetical protein